MPKGGDDSSPVDANSYMYTVDRYVILCSEISYKISNTCISVGDEAEALTSEKSVVQLSKGGDRCVGCYIVSILLSGPVLC
jgi:hypothetical protein